MQELREFDIAFIGLKTGFYDYDYHIGKSFLGEFANEEVLDADLNVHLDLDRQDRMLVFDFQITGELTVVCDRCLEPFQMAVDLNHQIVAKFGEDDHEEDDHLIVLSEKRHKVNVAQYIYEFVVLSLPIQHIHPDNEDGSSGCNPEMLQKLEELKHTRSEDPRWDALKKLKK